MTASRTRQDAHAWTVALLEDLEDGEWHDYKETVARAGSWVPQEMAFRKAEYYRSYHYRKAGKEVQDRRSGDRDDTIRTGQRLVVTKSVQSLARHGRVEIEYDDSVASKRRRPVMIRRVS